MSAQPCPSSSLATFALHPESHRWTPQLLLPCWAVSLVGYLLLEDTSLSPFPALFSPSLSSLPAHSPLTPILSISPFCYLLHASVLGHSSLAHTSGVVGSGSLILVPGGQGRAVPMCGISIFLQAHSNQGQQADSTVCCLAKSLLERCTCTVLSPNAPIN